MFSTLYPEILEQVNAINPTKYASTRNYVNGAITKLSPYISRGVISTSFIYKKLIERGFVMHQIQKFVQELAWRDYYQQVWITKSNAIDLDLKQNQYPITTPNIPTSILKATTGITAIDTAIKELYHTGYMHNHLRMYIAGITCNVAQAHWYNPSKWMYYNLLDADWASNALSWQWVAGSFSNKKYIANQENINKYCNTNDTNTFLDLSYENFPIQTVPSILKDNEVIQLETILPKSNTITINNNVPTLVYNFYNLDFHWHSQIKANRILLLEPSFFKKYPSNNNVIQFVLDLSKNINELQIFVGSFEQLQQQAINIIYKEHPTAAHYKGNQEQREWLAPSVKGYYPSFFSYWKKIEKHLK
jgi:deoxyribodipyrimidine photo-lyase